MSEETASYGAAKFTPSIQCLIRFRERSFIATIEMGKSRTLITINEYNRERNVATIFPNRMFLGKHHDALSQDASIFCDYEYFGKKLEKFVEMDAEDFMNMALDGWNEARETYCKYVKSLTK